MKKRFLIGSLIVGAALTTLPRALAEVVVRLHEGQLIRVEKVEKMEVNQEGNGLVKVTYLDGTTAEYSIADITEMIFADEQIDEPWAPEPSDDPNVITIEWGGDAPVVKCSAPEVTVSVEGDDVMLTNTNIDTEYTYILRGKSENGSLTLKADYKSTIVLDGVDLTSQLEEALNIKCGKRIALVINDGTVNTLQDPTEDKGQKGALYCKGHLEIEGGGELNLTGNVKHALATKEYLQLKKKFAGKLNILAAASDGIHAGQYFQMNAGNVKIRNIQGDGIQAEATGEEGEENDGMMIIKGGQLDIVTSGDAAKGLKASTDIAISGGDIKINQSGGYEVDETQDVSYISGIKGATVTISDGTLNITTSGSAARGISADEALTISGGVVDIVNSGEGVGTAESGLYDNLTAKGLGCDGDVMVLGGTVSIAMSGKGGRGIKADMNVVVGDEATGNGPVLTITTTGAALPEAGSTSGGGNTPWWAPGGGWNPGGGGPGGGREEGGSGAKAIKCGDAGCTVGGCYYQYGGNILITTTGSMAEGIEAKAATTTAMNFEGGNAYIQTVDDCINSAGQINFDGANVVCISTGNDAIDSNYGRAGSVTITDGVLLTFGSGGAEMGIDCDNMAYVLFKGGIVVGGGGNQGGGTSSLGSGSIHYKWWSTSISYQVGRYYSAYGGGENAFTFTLPVARSSSNNLYACDYFKSGTSYTVGYNTVAPTEGEAILFRTTPTDLVGTPLFWKRSGVTSGTQVATFSPS